MVNRDVAIAMLLACASIVRGAESPNFTVSTISTQNIYTATTASSNLPGFLPHINFPTIKNHADGTLEVDFTVGQTHGVGVFGQHGYSYDGGLTWAGFTATPPSTPNSSLVLPTGQTSYGTSFATSNGSGTTTWNNTLYTSTNGGTNWNYANANFNTGSVSYTSAYNNFGDVVQSGSLLLTTGYAQRLGFGVSELVLFASSNNGSNWTRRSTIASYSSDPAIAMGPEGPSEGSVVRLDNGKLLSVFRTGQTFPTTDINATLPPMMWALSQDDGLNWTTPKTLGVAGTFPLLHKMPDGSVALTYGRYGAKVMFVDSSGLRWTTPTVIYNGPGSGYVDMKPTANGGYCFVYDQSGFYPPGYNSNPPPGYVYNSNQSANLKAAILSIQQQPVADNYHWVLEYHGDVSPDTLPQPWTKSQTGIANQYLWADQGQDYLRINTGATGSSTTLNYALSGGSWQALDFSKGALIELRARTGSDTTVQGSADVVFGDGTNGAATFQLTGSGAILQGQGQSAYYAVDHPGFASTKWHNYRIVVAPDPSAGGTVTAKVYLDGNFAAPILSRALAASALHAIQIGDEVATFNGIFDLDYLRFSDLDGQWSADHDGSYNGFDNWSATIPDGADATANFLGAITAPRSVTLDTSTTLGHVLFNNANRYTIVGSGTINLQTSAGHARIALQGGDHSILVPVNLLSDADITGPGTLTMANIDGPAGLIVASGASIVARRIQTGALTINGSVAIAAGRDADKTSVVDSLSVAAYASFDLGDNDLIVNYSGASPLATIQSLIISGYGSGTWSGPGIRSSVALASTALGYVDRGADILIRYALVGDANLSGGVDTIDFNLLAANFSIGARLWSEGDFNYDGTVDTIDFNLLASNFGQAMPADAGTPKGALIPEPTSAAQLALVLLSSMRWRRS